MDTTFWILRVAEGVTGWPPVIPESGWVADLQSLLSVVEWLSGRPQSLIRVAEWLAASTASCTTPVLLCTTMFHARATLYYKVLRHSFFVLFGTTPELLCTTRYYSSATLFCTVLRQYYARYYSSTTLHYKVPMPVLLRTTTYYSSATLHHKVPQSTTPVLFCTTRYHKVLRQFFSVPQSTTPILFPSKSKTKQRMVFRMIHVKDSLLSMGKV